MGLGADLLGLGPSFVEGVEFISFVSTRAPGLAADYYWAWAVGFA